MANVSKWTGVGVAMSDAPGTATAVSAISKAAIGVCLTATTPTAGAYVLINAAGMNQVNGRIFRVGTVVLNVSFQLEGENTTDYSAFTSGSYQVVTFPNTVSTLTTVNGSGGEFDFIDTTTIHDKAKSQIPGMASAISYSFDSIWDVSDATLVKLKQASDNQAQRAFQILFQNGQRSVFYGYVGTALLPGGSTGGIVSTKVTITVSAGQTNYAT